MLDLIVYVTFPNTLYRTIKQVRVDGCLEIVCKDVHISIWAANTVTTPLVSPSFLLVIISCSRIVLSDVHGIQLAIQRNSTRSTSVSPAMNQIGHCSWSHERRERHLFNGLSRHEIDPCGYQSLETVAKGCRQRLGSQR